MFKKQLHKMYLNQSAKITAIMINKNVAILASILALLSHWFPY